MAGKPPWLTPNLVLGWKVTKSLEPQHWDKANAKPGKHLLTDVVTAAPNNIAHHTVIIAQSGSGKSFFLGRLVEEILLKTRCRILVLDPNSDFRAIAEPKDAKYWTDPKYRYDRVKRKGFLADERTQADFLSRWNKVTTLLHGRSPDTPRKKGNFRPLQLDWRNFPVDVLAEETAPALRDALQHCHSFVTTLADLARFTNQKPWLADRSFFKKALELCKDTQIDENVKDDEAVLAALREAFGSVEVTGGRARSADNDENVVVERGGTTVIGLPSGFQSLKALVDRDVDEVPIQELERFFSPALISRQLFSSAAFDFYFARVMQLEGSGQMDPRIRKPLTEPPRKRIEVVDLPSLPDRRAQKFAISTFLEVAWTRARADWEVALKRPEDERDTRVPTFIVVEEAHNLIPSKASAPIDKKLREQFRRIAAEGRKFGLFLILVSQRPDKLDRMIMSECENRAVMRVGSSFVLRTTCEILGLEGVLPRMTEKILDFDLGRALLVGPWVADEPAFLVSAARRTKEGGRDLDPDYWAKPVNGGKGQKLRKRAKPSRLLRS
jgi:Helicase HerA, central domain